MYHLNDRKSQKEFSGRGFKPCQDTKRNENLVDDFLSSTLMHTVIHVVERVP